MDRKEFLSLLGVGAAALIANGFLTSCSSKDNPVTPAGSVDFTLNLTDSAYSALQTNGGYLYYDNVIVARTKTGAFIAISAICTHAGGTVAYLSSSNTFRCPLHGSNFTAVGAVSNGPATTPLTQYKTSLNGSILRVYS